MEIGRKMYTGNDNKATARMTTRRKSYFAVCQSQN